VAIIKKGAILKISDAFEGSAVNLDNNCNNWIASAFFVS
jgi:hypothetical protein